MQIFCQAGRLVVGQISQRQELPTIPLVFVNLQSQTFRGGVIDVGLGLTEAWQLLEAAHADPQGDRPPVGQVPEATDLSRKQKPWGGAQV